MSTERIIQVADLSLILGSLRSLQRDIGSVSSQVQNVGDELLSTRSELARLESAFSDFVEADLKAKELSLAETRQVKIRQEIENTFGQHGVVRRQAIGILQASDIQLVRQETIRSATEELMLSVPRYWLAPALVALGAWLADNRELAQRALAEAMRRDEQKTSLFFALVSRRANRPAANRVWLDRYFGLQDPANLDRQTVVMVDALANGVFNTDASQLCSGRISSWIAELSQRAGFAEAQRQQWSDALRSKLPNAGHDGRYPHLSRFSPTWNAAQQSLNEAAMQGAVLAHFLAVFNGEIRPASSVLNAVDALLTTLVTRFDVEELPLRRQEELCRLIIEESGDKRAAEGRYALQSKTLEEKMDFTQLLTNAAMHPETSHVTRATQRFAIAHSREWIMDAHADVTARARQAVPERLAFSLEDWTGDTAAGENEAALLGDLDQHLSRREQAALAQARLGPMHWAAFGFGGLLVVMGLGSGWFMTLVGLALLGWGFLGHSQVKKLRLTIAAEYAQLREKSAQALRACLAEAVEYRRDLAARDGVAADVTALLEDIRPDQHMLSGHDTARRVLATVA